MKSSMTTNGTPTGAVAPDVIERCLMILRCHPAGLITDIDGTISAIAPTPGAAFVSEPVKRTLARLAHRLDLVAAVSGRSAANAATMVGVDALVYVGNHGMERLEAGQLRVHPVAAVATTAVRAALTEIAAGFPDAAAPWLIIENKGVTGTVHYRLAPEPDAARSALLPWVETVAGRHGLIVTEGRMIIEVRPNVVVNKGTAIAELVAERGLRGVVFLGDDVTDVDGFVALRQLRETSAVSTARVGVVGAETSPLVLAEIDVAIAGVDGCSALLGAIADRLDHSSILSDYA